MAKEYHISIITHSNEMPSMSCKNFFHSIELFVMLEQTPGMKPYMVVAQDDEGHVHAHMLTILRRRGALIPPYIFTQGRSYGEGEYENEAEKEVLFSLMLQAITRHLLRWRCLYIEFSDISHKMFGYKWFRKNDYFPVPWQQIHNSHHSKSPQERITERANDRVEHAYQMGIETREVESRKEIETFYKLLRKYYRFRYQRHIPSLQFFLALGERDDCHISVTIYKNKIVGGSVCVYSEGNAYLWFQFAKKKSHPLLHPSYPTLWYTLVKAHENHQEHTQFMNVGLPYKRNRLREFILSFGGIPVGTYRWFRFSFNWMNRLFAWFYGE